jgi:Fe-S-cluster-containing dehydrogenase component/DMSO reductase anchor subunit
MRKGFIFNHNKCVNCNACSAACILENGWTVHPRSIYTYNSKADHLLPLINLSLACNHCESAVCMEGCPASAYSREAVTGAIILDEIKCIGCRYCQWNCPYDAPKFDYETGIIGKCNLCYTGLAEGRLPACSMACPTGALSFGQLSGHEKANVYNWFPVKKLNPAIEFTSVNNNEPLKIIPDNIVAQTDSGENKTKKNISGELSLIMFSFMATISVSIIVSSFLKGRYPDSFIFIPVLLATGISSLFHLGKKLKAWRSLANLKNSPISREIAAFILYAVTSSLAIFLRIPALLIASSITGLVFLMLIDSVYLFTARNKSVILHSGQTFISALIIISFISGIVLPFVFMALIKLGLFVYGQIINKLNRSDSSFRFLRIAFLVVPGMSLILHNSITENFIIIIFLTGELFDRILFYIDFNPVNINSLIEEQLNIERDEKKRDK